MLLTSLQQCVFSFPAVSCTQVVFLCMKGKLHTAWQSCNTVETDWKIQTLHVNKYEKKGKGVKKKPPVIPNLFIVYVKIYLQVVMSKITSILQWK